MKVIHILSDLQIGGMQKFCEDLVGYQVSINYEVEIWCLSSNPPRQVIQGVNVVGFGARCKFWNLKLILRILFGLMKMPEETKIHTHGIALYFSSLAIICLRNIRAFHTIHNLCDHEAGKARRVVHRLLYRLNLVSPVTISDEVNSSFHRFYRSCNATLIENGVPSSRSAVSGELKRELKEVYDVDVEGGNNIFLHVGRFDYQKNRKLLFDVFDCFARDNKAKLLVVGGEQDDNNPYYLEVKGHAGIESGAIVLLGNRTDVGQLGAISKYFILSSRFEGLPLALLEAMREGLICISTPAGGCASVLKDIGFVSQSFECDALHEALVMSTSCDSANVSHETIKKFRQNYTIEICGQSYHDLYFEHHYR